MPSFFITVSYILYISVAFLSLYYHYVTVVGKLFHNSLIHHWHIFWQYIPINPFIFPYIESTKSSHWSTSKDLRYFFHLVIKIHLQSISLSLFLVLASHYKFHLFYASLILGSNFNPKSVWFSKIPNLRQISISDIIHLNILKIIKNTLKIHWYFQKLPYKFYYLVFPATLTNK